MGSFEQNSSKLNSDGLSLGGRVGFSYLNLTAAFDLNFSANKMDNAAKDSWELRQYGLNLGVDFGKEFPFKTWFTFYPYAEFDHDSPTELFGVGYKFGVGFYPWFLEPISFLLEYRSNSFSEIEDAAGRRDLSSDSGFTSIYLGVGFYFQSLM